jgi:hypothetical protein
LYRLSFPAEETDNGDKRTVFEKEWAMRSCPVVLVMVILCLGCNRAEEARRKAAQAQLKQMELALENYHKTYKPPVPDFFARYRR